MNTPHKHNHIHDYLAQLESDEYEKRREIVSALLLVYIEDAIRYVQDHAGEFVELQARMGNSSIEALGSVELQLMEPEDMVDVLWEHVAPDADEVDFSHDGERSDWEAFQYKLVEHLTDASVENDETIDTVQELLAKYYTMQLRGLRERSELSTEDGEAHTQYITAATDGVEEVDFIDAEGEEAEALANIEYILREHFPEWKAEIINLMSRYTAAELQQEARSGMPSEIQWN